MRFRQVHLDFHTSGLIPDIGGRFSKEQFQKALKLGHVDSITVFSKCHHGWAYHPSTANTMHPNLTFDLLGAELEACREIGVNAPVYISAGLDEKEVLDHPEWLNVDPNNRGGNYLSEAHYHLMCYNTPYLDKLISQVEEVMEKYNPCGVFLDISNERMCVCGSCVKSMLEKGMDPTNMDDVRRHGREVYKTYCLRVEKAVRKYSSTATIFHNAGHIAHGRRDIAGYDTHLELESLPTGGWGYGTANGLDWTSTIAIIPWNLYLFYGDTKPLEDCYENIKRYVDYVDRRSPGHLSSWGRGDWVPVRSQSSLELTSSVYFYVDATILARAAALFGREADRKHYEALAGEIRGAINDKYLDRATGIYASGTQTELSVPLMWGVVPEEMVAKVAGNLARKVAEAGFHLDVGVLGAKAILNALSENGHAETAYKVAVQDTYPSWGWWIVNGATTLLENWNLEATRDISDNHMMFGEIGGWFFKGLGGIKPDPEAPGFKHILLRPNFVGPEEFEASHDAPCGRIVSAWTRRGNTVTYRVRIPANSTATLYLPANVDGGKVHQLGAGSHTLTLRVAK